MDLSTLQKTSHISKAFQSGVRTYTECRLHIALSPWITHPIEFRDIMRRTRSVISGSFALGLAVRDSWLANDLDIYIPHRTRKFEMVSYLIRREGFHVQAVVTNYTQTTEEEGPNLVLYNVAGMTSITKFTKRWPDGKTTNIDLIESIDGYALTPITNFDATWSMNWITADSITVAYPKLTLDHKGVYKKRQRLAAHMHLPVWKTKYTNERGFDTFHIMSGLVDMPCGALCRPLLRTSTDKHCLSIAFGKTAESSMYPQKVWGIRGTSRMALCANTACPNFCLNSLEVNHAYWSQFSKPL